MPTRIPSHTQRLGDETAPLVDPTVPGLASGIRDALEEPDPAHARANRGYELI